MDAWPSLNRSRVILVVASAASGVGLAVSTFTCSLVQLITHIGMFCDWCTTYFIYSAASVRKKL